MIPNYITRLDVLPLNVNGKVDKKKLPSPSLNLADENRIISPARNEIDKIIIDELKNMLHLDNISIGDSFFGIGGDSLNAITLCTHLSDRLKTSISVKDIFDNPIIKDLSDFISNIDLSEEIPQTIFKAESAKFYPLSSAQKRIYYANTLSGDKNIVYNVSGGILFPTRIAPSKVQNALNELIRKNDSFRTFFTYENGNLVQSILDDVQINIEIEQSSLDAKTLVNKFAKPFNLSKAPLLRAKLVFLDDGSSLLLLDTHHIIVDGTSLSIICRDFCKLYNGQEVNKNELQYTDYAVWEEDFLDSDKLKEYEEFWVKKFENQDFSTLNLPYDYALSNVKSYKGEKISVKLEKEQFEALEKIAKANNVSSYSVFLAAIYITLYKYTSQTDIIIGSPFAGRSFKETQDIIGMFVNNMILNKHIDFELNFTDFAKSVHEDVIAAISNQPYPFELLQKNLNLGSNNPLLDVMFTYQNIGNEPMMINDKPAEILTSDTKTAKFNLWFEIIPSSFTFNLEFNTDLFKLHTAKSILEHYIFILTQIISKSDMKISDFNMITPKEEKLLDNFNDTAMEINNDTVVSIFEEQVKKTPNKIAAVCNDKTLTYDELNKKSNSLAHHLINNGIKPNDIICIMTNRSLETIIAMLGILKAGAAFFNVDPTYPSDRTYYYIENSNTEYVLTQSELKNKCSMVKYHIEIDLDNNIIYDKNFENPNVKVKNNDLSYIIYTSGSTGTPKGVMLNQIGFANMVKAMTYALDYLRDGREHAIASVTSTPFDIFVYEIFVSLTHGMKVVMANNLEHRNPKLLDSLIRKHGVDVMTVTPSLMKINYDNREPDTALALVKNMVFGGEVLPQKFVDDLKALSSDITIFNIYGPSEITVLSNVQNLNGEKEITVGPPIKNTQIHILDKDMKKVPIGVVGEIYIAGIQVGLGYIGNPERTNSVFLDNPFGEGKIYKSGDIGRWTFDGKVQCLGRVDHQIKLRGLRIELGEIENKMSSIDGITSSVVQKLELDGKELLCGYYVTDQNISENKVRDFLRKSLPPYMIPTYIIKLDKMPYTINRKIDRKALPLPEKKIIRKVSEEEKAVKKASLPSSSFINDTSSNEATLLQIWKNILKIDDISLDDNFFDIGGDSLSAIDMQIAALKYGFNFEYADIFNFPTIRQLAHKLPKEKDDFLKTYDYTIVNEVLERNTAVNLKTISLKDPGNILLIGGTGYLGSHIAYEFLTQNTGDIYFLIRNKNNVPAKYRLTQSLRFYFGDKFVSNMENRIKVVTGDIVTDDVLNLTYKDLAGVVKNTSVVINSGALVKHFGLKKEFEDINVTGTENVIKFCKKYGKRLMHISTISVSGNGEKEHNIVETPENINDKKIFTENNLYIGQDLTNVYGLTKFKAEIKVLEAIHDGLDAQVLRLGNITNRYSDGAFQRNTEDNAFARRLKAYIEIGAFPRYVLGHELELTPVDLAANATIKILNHTSDCNMFHIMDSKLLPIKELMQTSTSMGIDIVPVSDRLMTDIITGILDDESRQDVVSGIVHDLNKDKKLVYTSSIRLNSDFTENYLKNCRFSLEKN